MFELKFPFIERIFSWKSGLYVGSMMLERRDLKLQEMRAAILEWEFNFRRTLWTKPLHELRRLDETCNTERLLLRVAASVG